MVSQTSNTQFLSMKKKCVIFSSMESKKIQNLWLKLFFFCLYSTTICLCSARSKFPSAVRNWCLKFSGEGGCVRVCRVWMLKKKKTTQACLFRELLIHLLMVIVDRRLLAYDLLTYCSFASQFLICDTLAAFLILDVNPLQHFASSVISARSLLECSLIGCWISARSLLA